jgi:allantoinase
LIIRNGKIVTIDGIVEADICVSDGKIASVEKSSTGQASKSIDSSGLLILPGLIDPHVHFRDPGSTDKEDFTSGTRGAAAGGTTTVLDMPNTDPAISSADAFLEKKSLVKSKAVVDYGLVAAASHENLPQIARLAELGAAAFKTYMISPPKERQREYVGAFTTRLGQLYEAMKEVQKTGLVHCVHAENDSLISTLTNLLRAQGRIDPIAHSDSRPNFTEEEAVFEALLLADVLHARLHLVHVSTHEALDLISLAKSRGVDASAETCPQYMYFTKEILEKRGPDGKFNPPSRTERDVSEMIAGLAKGDIDLVSTDHAPHTLEEKQAGWKDIFNAPSGTPGVETRLPLLLDLVHRQRISLNAIPRIAAEAAARRFGLFPRKGTIRIGSDADIVLVDYNEVWTIRASELQTKSWQTVLFDGMEVKGKVKTTLLRGFVVYEEGGAFAKPGSGEFLRPSIP